MAKRRKQSERAIIYAGILGGLSDDEINVLLKEARFRDLPPASFKMLNGKYLDKFKLAICPHPTCTETKGGGLNYLGELIKRPLPIGIV